MKKVLSVLAVAAAIVVLGCVTVFAVDSEAFGYLAGRQRSTARADLYAGAETRPEDERDEFLAENGIGEEPYSEEAAANYSYVAGQSRGASYRRSDDSERAQDFSGYSFVAGQQRGSSYQC